jgi:hypothetical protein
MPDTSLGRLLIVQVLGVATVALALIPAGAHLFSLISKMRLPPDQYLTAQRAYDNWALFGIAIVAAILLTALHTWLVANNTRACSCRPWRAWACWRLKSSSGSTRTP